MIDINEQQEMVTFPINSDEYETPKEAVKGQAVGVMMLTIAKGVVVSRNS